MTALGERFDVQLHFLSDWHVGTGQGRLGTIDAQLRRDGDNLPFVPAKTLVGVWRDACETVAEVLDGGDARPGRWQAWVIWLFGSQPARAGDPVAAAGQPPAPARLRVSAARAPEWLRAAVRAKPALQQAAVTLKPGVSIDDESGTARTGFLRVEERAIRGSLLTARVEVALDGAVDVLPEPAELLLRAGARLVESLGGKRNRGSGRVAVLLPGTGLATTGAVAADGRLTGLLDTIDLDDPARPSAPQRLPTPHAAGAVQGAARRTVRVVLRVETPVVAADGVLGNVVSTRSSIPGTALLGTVLARVEPACGLADLRVGDAVPAVRSPISTGADVTVRPALPLPGTWHRSDKGRGPRLLNTLFGRPDPKHQAKPWAGFVVPGPQEWLRVSAGNVVSTHAVVDDEARRPTSSGGGVFSYLGIPPGTLLCSDIVLPAGVTLRLAVGERLRFGRSRKDDFGLVSVVEVIDPVNEPAVDRTVGAGGELPVWCVSDVLLRDERLAPDPSPTGLARALSAALAPVTVRVAGDGATSVARREGFGVAWGRPRPSQIALRAGSVVVLAVDGPIDPERLGALERDGIGERTAEGFGRLRFDPPELRRSGTVALREARADDAPDAPLVGLPGDLDGAHPFEVNAWRRAVRRVAAGTLPEKLVPGIDALSGRKAQLGALRAQLERLALPDGEQLVRHWLDSTAAVRRRREAWGDALASVEALLVDRTCVWARLGLAGPQPDLVLAPGREDTVRTSLWTEAVTIALGEALRTLTRERTGAGAAHPSGDEGIDR